MKIEFPLYVAIDPTPGDEPADCLLTFPTFAAMTGAAQIRAEEGRPYGARNPVLYSGAQAKVQAAEDVAARFTAREWVPLSTLRPGAVFATKAGDRGVVHGGTAPDGLVRVVLLTNGGEETLYGHASVREVRV